MSASTGVLILAHGAATSVKDLPKFYEHIREGAPMSPRVLAVLEERYRAIGGSSPLNATTLSLTAKLQAELDRRHGLGAFRTQTGFRHAAPFIGDAMGHLTREKLSRVLVVVLSPHMSRFAKEGYSKALADVPTKVPVTMTGPWHMEPALLQFWTEAVATAWENVYPSPPRSKRLLFTAHSLPHRWVEGDTLEARLRESGEAVVRAAHIPEMEAAFVWQSASPTGEEWLGPDLGDVLRREARHGAKAVVVCPQGFVADHLETLYDVDILARRVAEDEGLAFARTPMPNDAPLMVQALADLVDRSRPSPAR